MLVQFLLTWGGKAPKHGDTPLLARVDWLDSKSMICHTAGEVKHMNAVASHDILVDVRRTLGAEITRE
jgi:hypothetical protein